MCMVLIGQCVECGQMFYWLFENTQMVKIFVSENIA